MTNPHEEQAANQGYPRITPEGPFGAGDNNPPDSHPRAHQLPSPGSAPSGARRAVPPGMPVPPGADAGHTARGPRTGAPSGVPFPGSGSQASPVAGTVFSPERLRDTAVQAGVMLGVTLLGGLLLLVNLAVAFSGRSRGGTDELFSGGDLILGWLLASGYLLSGTVSFFTSSSILTTEASLYLPATSIQILLFGGIVILASKLPGRSAADALKPRLIQAALISVATTLVMCILALIAVPGRSVVGISSFAWWMPFTGFLFYFLSSAAGLEIKARRQKGVLSTGIRTWFRTWPRMLRELALVGMTLAVVMLVGVVLGLIVMAFRDSSGIAGISYLGQLLLWCAAIGGLGGMRFGSTTGYSAESIGLFSFGSLPASAWLLLVLWLVGCLIAAIVAGYQRSDSRWDVRRALLYGGSALGFWLVAPLILGPTGNLGPLLGGFSGLSGPMRLSVTWWTPIIMVVWAAAIDYLAGLLPPVLHRSFPALAAKLSKVLRPGPPR